MIFCAECYMQDSYSIITPWRTNWLGTEMLTKAALVDQIQLHSPLESLTPLINHIKQSCSVSMATCSLGPGWLPTAFNISRWLSFVESHICPPHTLHSNSKLRTMGSSALFFVFWISCPTHPDFLPQSRHHQSTNMSFPLETYGKLLCKRLHIWAFSIRSYETGSLVWVRHDREACLCFPSAGNKGVSRRH